MMRGPQFRAQSLSMSKYIVSSVHVRGISVSRFLICKLITTMLAVAFELKEIYERIFHKGDLFILARTDHEH